MASRARRGAAPLGVIVLGLVTLSGVGCGGGTSGALTPSASLSTLDPRAERVFRLEWEVGPGRGDRRRISGHVYNEYGTGVDDVRLLVQGFDPSGAVVAQHLQRPPISQISPGARLYFEADLPPAHQYRVTVWSFQFQEAGPLN